MRRRSRSKFPVRPGKPSASVSPLEIGMCLVGLEIWREHGIDCVSDSEVLRAAGVNVGEAEVEHVKDLLKREARRHLNDAFEKVTGTGQRDAPVSPELPSV